MLKKFPVKNSKNCVKKFLAKKTQKIVLKNSKNCVKKFRVKKLKKICKKKFVLKKIIPQQNGGQKSIVSQKSGTKAPSCDLIG